jgi:hypothetical protein
MEWSGCFEKYFLTDFGGKTKLHAEVQVEKEWQDHMDTGFTKGLMVVKVWQKELISVRCRRIVFKVKLAAYITCLNFCIFCLSIQNNMKLLVILFGTFYCFTRNPGIPGETGFLFSGNLGMAVFIIFTGFPILNFRKEWR